MDIESTDESEIVAAFNTVPPCEIVLSHSACKTFGHEFISEFSQFPDDPSWNDIQAIALDINGYELSQELGLGECGDFANGRSHSYVQTRKWGGNAAELWCCLFFEQRRWRHFGEEPEGEDFEMIKSLYTALRQELIRDNSDLTQEERLKIPVFVPPRPKKDSR